MSEPSQLSNAGDLQARVAYTADIADLHATVPTLLLELQALVGTLATTVTTATERGRRPFRPGPDWSQRLGELAYGVYLLADQSGVDVKRAVEVIAQYMEQRGRQATSTDAASWPFEG